MLACAVCGEPNPERARFCLQCGAPIGREAAPPPETRKVVTVVFSDLAGSTSLGERLDPESLSRLMARWFERARAVLERHGGTVQKFIGDAVVAVFGIPTVHEEDALRAVRAAAEMYWLATTAESSGIVELLAGDLAAAERELRKGVELLDGMGERAYLSTMSTVLADVLERAGDDAEAERFARISEQASDPDDIDSQARWRAVQARLLAKRGRLQAAEALAREAWRLAEPVDVLGLQADCQLALGAVLRAAGRDAEAQAAFARALDLLDRKGNLVLARRVRGELPVV